jgi:hypothetical protein
MNSPHILIVDDNLSDAVLIQELLLKEQFHVLVAHNDQEFRNHLQNDKIDLILSELNANDYDYQIALNLVKTSNSDIPFVIISRYITADAWEEIIQKGATDCISKANLHQLIFVAKRTLRELELIRENLRSKTFLRYHDEQLRQLLSNMNEAVVMTDKADLILFVNKKFCQLTGYFTEELIGQSLKKFFFDQNSMTPENIQASEKSNEKELICKNQKKIWVRMSGSSIFNSGNIGSSIHIFEDVDEQKRTEHEVRKLTRAVDQSAESIIITDTEGIIEYANPITFELTGYTPNELLGKNASIFSSGKNSSVEDDEMWNTIKSGRVWKGEFQNRKKNGELFLESATISPVTNSQDEITHFLAIKKDITQKRKLTEELIKAKEKAEENDRLKTAFLANISHEIRTPLNGTFGFSELLRTPGLTEELKETYINIIEQSGQRMLNVINDIVDISRIESRQMEIHIQETNLNKVLKDLAASFAPEANEKKLLLSAEVPSIWENFLIKTDRGKLIQVISNLIKNAIKFTHSGAVSFGYLPNGKTLRFFVKDSGVGIPDSQIKLIFERFSQGSTSLTRAYEGFGLGLPISKALIEMLGGTIWVDSKPGEGSTFYFEIPISEDEFARIPEKSSPQTKTLQSITILIVEDDLNSLMFMKTLLRLEKISVLEANNGIKAIEAVKNHPEIDLVLIDMKMPEMDGLEATSHIKQIRPELPVIAQTAYAMREDVENARKAGCDDYIHKPVKKQLLMEKIRNLI